MIIEFKNHTNAGILIKGLAEFDKEVIEYCVEWRIRRAPYMGMKQPTPPGTILGSESILQLRYGGKPLRNYSFKVYENDSLISGGWTNDGGYSSNIGVKMPFRGEYNYKLEIIGSTEQNEAQIDNRVL